MRRREFITLLGWASAGWPIEVRAQKLAPPVIGFLHSTSAAATANRVAAFRQGLSEAGFAAGSKVVIEFRFAEGQLNRLVELAEDLVSRRVAVLVTDNTSTPAAKAATSTIPIVFVSGGDPVDAGLIGSLNRPGGNVTGISFFTAPVIAKRLELLHELVPKPAVIGALMDPNLPQDTLQQLELAGSVLGREILIAKAGTESEINAAVARIAQAGAGALFVGTGANYNSRRQQLVVLAARHRLPASYHLREFVVAGGLMSYGASDTDAHRRAGRYVARILKGEKPGDLAVELPTKYDLVINLATARTLGIEVPRMLRALADEVIE
jgi:putative tryptophan/tyrosine transport system substrate-binding protein